MARLERCYLTHVAERPKQEYTVGDRLFPIFAKELVIDGIHNSRA